MLANQMTSRNNNSYGEFMKQFLKHSEFWLILLLAIIVNFSGIIEPIIRNDDPTLYANIAKHIVLSGDFIDLMFHNTDWLDKPHFPFWITALSFKVFGINSFAYILPGFLFHLLGAFFTYHLAYKLYQNIDIARISAIIYLSSLHLMMSSIDVRAEAYLLGEIIGACYFWYLYNECFSFRYLILGALFTALALMTKGLFVLLTICSGLVFVWAYTGELINFIKAKWILALVLSLIFTAPEVYALYYQFDLYPEKLVFGHHHISGIRWFFWDSQFGRFFANGPITVNHVQGFHYIFFVHTFLWAFLPWSIMFVVALWSGIKNKLANTPDKKNFWYLFGSFVPTFILFSLTKFQLDHYTNIIMPFAAILCSSFLYKCRIDNLHHRIFYIQLSIACIILILVVVLFGVLFPSRIFMLLPVLLMLYFWNKDILVKSIAYSVIAISMVFILMLQIETIVARHDLGYQAVQYLKNLPKYPVVDYNVNSTTLEFHTKSIYLLKEKPKQLLVVKAPYYLVIKTSDINKLHLNHTKLLINIPATTVDKVISNLLNLSKLKEDLVDYSVILVGVN